MRRYMRVRRTTVTRELTYGLFRLAMLLLSLPFQVVAALMKGVWKGYKEDLRVRKSSSY